MRLAVPRRPVRPVPVEQPLQVRRRRRPSPVLVALVLVTVVAAVGWTVLGSGVLDVERVTVTGTSRASEQQVVDAAGVRLGQPLARVDLDAAGQRVRGALPVVREVVARRSWPATVRLRVVERTPAVAVPAEEGGYRLLDDSGVVFATEDAAPEGVPVVQAAAGTEPAALTAAASVVTSLPPDLAGRISTVTARSPDEVDLQLADGRSVVWGGAEDNGLKARVLDVLLDQPGSVYDVSVPEAPTARS